MRVIDYVGMASRNLVRQKARTILTIIAITIGSLSLILMASLLLSVHQSLVDQFKNFGAFDLVTAIKDPNAVDNNSLLGGNGGPNEGKMINDATVTAMRSIPHVTRATGVLSGAGINTMRLEGQDKKTWASITAIDPTNDVFDLPIKAGRKLAAGDMDKIVIGSRFAEDMGYAKAADLLGKKVLLNYHSGPGAPDWGALPPKPPVNADEDWFRQHQSNGVDIPVEIVGVADSGALDDGQSYIPMAFAKRLMVSVSWQMQGTPTTQPIWVLQKEDQFKNSGYNAVIMKVDDQARIGEVSDAVKKLGYGATTAQKMLDQINKIMYLVGAVLAVIGGISLFVATIGIVNTMVMAIYERTREIGVLRANGATRAVIRRLFTFEASLLGFWGGVFGIVISFGLTKLAGKIITTNGAILGSLPLDNIGNFPWWLIVAVIAFTSLVGMFSGLFPAIRAARMNPVDALRYE